MAPIEVDIEALFGKMQPDAEDLAMSFKGYKVDNQLTRSVILDLEEAERSVLLEFCDTYPTPWMLTDIYLNWLVAGYHLRDPERLAATALELTKEEIAIAERYLQLFCGQKQFPHLKLGDNGDTIWTLTSGDCDDRSFRQWQARFALADLNILNLALNDPALAANILADELASMQIEPKALHL